jgi:hypothetical protein
MEEETLKGIFSNLFLHAAQLFGQMWSTHANWLQHLPALSKVALEFLFLHNF